MVKPAWSTPTGTFEELDTDFDDGQQFLPSGFTVEAIAGFPCFIMVGKACHPESGSPKSPAFTLSVGALTLGFRCLRGSPGNCVPLWPLVSAIAEFMI